MGQARGLRPTCLFLLLLALGLGHPSHPCRSQGDCSRTRLHAVLGDSPCAPEPRCSTQIHPPPLAWNWGSQGLCGGDTSSISSMSFPGQAPASRAPRAPVPENDLHPSPCPSLVPGLTARTGVGESAGSLLVTLTSAPEQRCPPAPVQVTVAELASVAPSTPI